MQLAESTDDKISIATHKDIADEERVHAGEFLRLLNHRATDEMELYAKGAREVDEMIENIKYKKNSGSEEEKNSTDDLTFPGRSQNPYAQDQMFLVLPAYM